MVVRAAADEVDALGKQRLRKSLGIGDHLLLILFEFGRESLLERNRLRRDDVHERAALRAGEDGLVDELSKLLVVGHDETASRSAQRLVGGGSHEIRIRHGRGMQSRRDQTRDVRDVHHEICAHLVRNGTELIELDGPGIGGSTRDDEFGLAFESLFPDVRKVYPARCGIQPVRDEVEKFAAEVDGRAVGEVSALGEGHAKHGVTRFEHGIIHREIGV